MDDALDDLIACPTCDLLYHAVTPAPGERAVCARCHTVLISPRRNAGLRIVALALAAVILVLGAVGFPFLEIRAAGFSHNATILDTALAFSGGPLIVLSLAVTTAIVLLPLARALLLIYVLGPVVAGRRPWPGAARAFRWTEAMRPWSMAEIFVIGCAVALIKIADLAHVSLGPAFWMFATLVVVLLVQDTLMCRWTVWRTLER